MRKKVYELVDFSDDEHDVVLASIHKLSDDLNHPEGEPMSFPTLAISPTAIVCGDHGFDTSGEFALVLDVKELTMGALESITPIELGYALFDEDVRHKVVHAMINAAAWIKDVEVRGLNVYNEREVRGFFAVIQETFVRNVANHLARKLGL